MSIESKQIFLKRALEDIKKNNLEGDYFEFGVFEGQSFIDAYRFAQLFGLPYMKFYAFDSFQGLPSSARHFRQGQYNCSKKQFVENLDFNNIPKEMYFIIEGWFEEVLPKTELKTKASLIFIDCDLYESTVPVLDFIIFYLQKGTIIGFDDWYSFPEGEGESKAFKEWTEKNPHLKIEHFAKIGKQGESFKVGGQMEIFT